MNQVNYQKQMEQTLARIALSGKQPRLLLHSCCGPCSSYVLETLVPYFQVTVYFSNSNIWPYEEYEHRLAEQERLIREMALPHPVELLAASYDHTSFLHAVQGLEAEPEGGARCEPCFRLRMTQAARAAKAGGFDCFTTTLSVSPHKNAPLLNEIGLELAKQYGVPYLVSDFKKREGYKRSVVLAKQYSLYRQNYCGCEFSRTQKETKEL